MGAKEQVMTSPRWAWISMAAAWLAGSAAAHSLNRDSALTIYPVGLAGKPSSQVGEVVGMLLERGGMENLELTVRAFRPPVEATFDAAADAFAAFVKAEPPSTEYALYSEFRGTPQRGIVQNDHQADFKALDPKSVEDCDRIVVRRLASYLER